MKDRELKLDNGWMGTLTYKKLYQAGYSVGGYVDKGVAKYVLYRIDDNNKLERIHEFDSMKELNNMLKLILPPEGE